MTAKYLLAIDAGTGSVRAVIFDLKGNQISCEQREWYHKEDPRYKGSMDFDWNFNWDLARTCIKLAIKNANIDPKEIAGISTTCMREGIVLYDENYKELWACANVDARSEDEVIDLIKSSSTLELELYKKSGQSFALDALPRLLWVKKHQPDVYEKMRYIGMFNDWLILKLTGILAVDPSNGSTSGLMDLRSRDFDKAILECCGIRTDILPKCVECGTVIGNVNKKGAEDTGLCEGTPVVVGGGDAQLGSIGVGVVSSGLCMLYMDLPAVLCLIVQATPKCHISVMTISRSCWISLCIMTQGFIIIFSAQVCKQNLSFVLLVFTPPFPLACHCQFFSFS